MHEKHTLRWPNLFLCPALESLVNAIQAAAYRDLGATDTFFKVPRARLARATSPTTAINQAPRRPVIQRAVETQPRVGRGGSRRKEHAHLSCNTDVQRRIMHY